MTPGGGSRVQPAHIPHIHSLDCLFYSFARSSIMHHCVTIYSIVLQSDLNTGGIMLHLATICQPWLCSRGMMESLKRTLCWRIHFKDWIFVFLLRCTSCESGDQSRTGQMNADEEQSLFYLFMKDNKRIKQDGWCCFFFFYLQLLQTWWSSPRSLIQQKHRIKVEMQLSSRKLVIMRFCQL